MDLFDDIFYKDSRNAGKKKWEVVGIHKPVKPASWYARRALEGGMYLSPQQSVEAFIAADYPIEKVETQSKPKPSVTTSAHYDAYAAAIERQNQLLRQQQELMRQQREREYNAVVDANNRQAAQSMNEAYILNMLTKKNLAQNLKNIGVSGGAAESTLRDIENAYMNSRLDIDGRRLDANNKARLSFEKGINEDYMKYLAKAYELGKSQASKASKSTKTTTKTSGGKKVTGYKIKGNTKVHTGDKDEIKKSIFDELSSMGLTRNQISQYLYRNEF